MKKILLPPRYRTWSKDGWHVYFDPHNQAVVRVNDSGQLLLRFLQEHMDVDMIAAEVATRFGMEVSVAAAAVDGFFESLIRSGFLHEHRYVERPRPSFPDLSFPLDVYVLLTHKCNLKCPYCYNKTDRENKIKLERIGLVSPTMSTEDFKSLLADLVMNGARRILFTGGEPLLRPDALELVRFTRSIGPKIRLEMLTNASLITPDIATEMCELLDTVTISLDGHEKHIHEEQRGQHTFDATVRGIRTLVDAKAAAGQRKPYICLVPALTAKNVGLMKEIYEYGLDVLRADGLAPIVFQAGDHQQMSIAQIPQLDVFLEEQRRTNDYLSSREGSADKMSKPEPLSSRNHCGVGHHEISIDPSGYVYPCQSLQFDEFVCGNVRERNIKEIFDTSAVMQKVRGTLVETLPVCSHCDLKHLCHGGCRATAYNIYREFDHHNEVYCRMLETQAVSRIWSAAASLPQ